MQVQPVRAAPLALHEIINQPMLLSQLRLLQTLLALVLPISPSEARPEPQEEAVHRLDTLNQLLLGSRVLRAADVLKLVRSCSIACPLVGAMWACRSSQSRLVLSLPVSIFPPSARQTACQAGRQASSLVPRAAS